MTWSTVVAVAIVSAVVASSASQAPIYMDTSQSIDSRVADLLSRMTIEEKVAQLGGVWESKAQMQDVDGVFQPERAAPILGQGIGHVARPSEIAG